MTNLQPLEDRVIIKPIKKTEPEKTAAGIITDTIKKNVVEGIVIAVGEGYTARDTGVFVPCVLRKNDIVLYGATAGTPIEVLNEKGEKEDCLLMRESDILMLVGRNTEN